MNKRIEKKHVSQWRDPFHKAIALYNGRIRKCQRWRNRHKAQKIARLSFERKLFKRG